MMPLFAARFGRWVRLVAIAFCLSAWTVAQRIEAAPVPSKTTAEEQAAAEAPPDPALGGDGDTEVEVFGVILLLFVLLMYLWRARD